MSSDRIGATGEYRWKTDESPPYDTILLLGTDDRVIERSHHRPGKIMYDWRHYLAVIQRKPGALRNGAPFTEMPDAFRRPQDHMPLPVSVM